MIMMGYHDTKLFEEYISKIYVMTKKAFVMTKKLLTKKSLLFKRSWETLWTQTDSQMECHGLSYIYFSKTVNFWKQKATTIWKKHLLNLSNLITLYLK